MGDSTGTRVYECETVVDFLTRLRPPAALFEGGITNTVLYRGVGDSRYKLVPTALRADDQSKKNVSRIKALDTNPKNIVDATVLRLFYQEANRNGLPLPNISSQMHESLCMGALNAEASGLMFDTLLPIFGLAQHYGLPTRLLDWSFDPFVAAYFAAKSGTRHLSEPASKVDKIAVWFVQSRFLDSNVRVVHAPYSGNPNLAAQKGAFTFVRPPKDEAPLNVVGTDATRGRRDFHKVELPLGEAPKLLLEMRLLGYDAGRLFPGYAGAALAVEELATLAQSSQVEKRVFEDLNNS